MQHQETMLNFIHTLVNSNNELSIEHNPKDMIDEAGHLITIFKNGKPFYQADGYGPDAASAHDAAVAILFSQLMQRLMIDAHGFVSVLDSGSIDFRFDEGKMGAIVIDRSSKTLTVTLVSK